MTVVASMSDSGSPVLLSGMLACSRNLYMSLSGVAVAVSCGISGGGGLLFF
jgi:hypothetical protein